MKTALMILATLGCGGSEVDTEAEPETTPSIEPAPEDCGADERVVTFETSDGVTLQADFQPATDPDMGAIVLLHMIPPSNDRSGFPSHVRGALHDLGFSVLNVDRRGAGGSGGNAIDAYTGDGGRFDAEAAVTFLQSSECAVNTDKLIFVGASNGSTSVMDYAVAHDASLPDAAALIWMSPGTYTETQNRVSANQALLEAIPMQWYYPTNEPWSESFAGPANWEMIQRGLQHGTLMFDGGELEDDTVADLLRFVGERR